jgi:hypothetical protein
MLALLLISAALTPVLAGEVDFSVLMKDAEDKVMTDCVTTQCEAKREITLRIVALTALNVAEQNLPADEQIRRGLLAQTIYKSIGTVTLDAKDTELVKTLIAKRGYPPVVVLQAFQQLDPASIKR